MATRKTKATKALDCKGWLAVNGYGDVLAKIERLEERWKVDGKKTRRAWWRVLAGHEGGTSCTVHGVTFPVLHAARERLGWDGTAHRQDTPGEVAPGMREGGRLARVAAGRVPDGDLTL